MIAACTFFEDQMADMPGMTKLIQTQYCQGDHAQCARLMVSSVLGMGAVPEKMFPGEKDKAILLLAD